MHHYGYMFRVLHCCVSQNITSALGQMDLTSAQGHIMGFLAGCKEPPCPKDLEEAFQLSHPTVSGLLSRLEKKDFIELRPDSDDRRCKRIYIRPKGWECNEKMYRTIQETESHLVQGFSEDEKAQFADFLTRAARNMGSDLRFELNKEETNP